ncbi:MAG: hypothetical protein ACK444_09110, partial [Flavobacteriales bacterium]
MIIKLKSTVSPEQAQTLAKEYQAFLLFDGAQTLVTGSALKELPTALESLTEQYWVFANDMQLSSRKYRQETREISFGKTVIGGKTKHTVLIGGPCSVESESQINSAAQLLVKLGLNTLRGGAYKPRTSPYSFQGLGLEGLQLLAKMREAYGLTVITEARDATHIDEIIEYTDVVQIGAKAMYDQGILRACAKINKPVLI